MLHRKNIFITFAAALTMSAAPFALAANAFSDWDSDGNNEINDNEWTESCTNSGLFKRWDMDNDGLIDNDEFSSGLFRFWDVNGDGVLEQGEWAAANDGWLSDYNTQFTAWDSDKDGYVEYHEHSAYFGSTAYFSDWDTNNTLYVEPQEFCQNLFNTWDKNNDNTLNSDEFDKRWWDIS